MAELTINVTFKVSDEAYQAYEDCKYQAYLHDEIADIMYTVFRNDCINKNPSQQIIKIADAFNEQFNEQFNNELV